MDYSTRLDGPELYVVLKDAAGRPMGAVPVDQFTAEHVAMAHMAELVDGARLVAMRLNALAVSNGQGDRKES